MTTFKQAALLSLFTMVSASTTEHLPIFGKPNLETTLLVEMSKIIDTSTEIEASSTLGSALLASARSLQDGNGNGGSQYSMDMSFLVDYSIKFQGCHHISQWNLNADGEDDVRIQTKRLARFRLCPTGSCQPSRSSGCSSKYGDYVVDMSIFVSTFLQARADARDYQCSLYADSCQDTCDGSDDEDSCMYGCYAGYGLNYCVQSADATAESLFDPLDYAQCAQFDFANGRRRLDGANDDSIYYYIGPYCANQGGSIYLGLFNDNTCTTFISEGKETFYEKAGFELPYTSDSLISYDCFSCNEPAQNDANADDIYYQNLNDQADSDNVKQFCENVYAVAGKCESKMSISYPNEAACTYIEGVKLIRNDGVIRTHSVRKSKAASVTIGLFTTLAVLLGAYVFYLRNSEYCDVFGMAFFS